MAANEVKVSIIVNDNGTMQLTEKSAKKLGKNLDDVGASSRTADRNIKGVANTSSNATKNFSKMSQGMGGLVGAYAAFAAQVFALSAAFNFLKSAGDLASLQAGQAAQTAATGIAMRTLTNDIIAATDAQVQFRDAAQAAAIGSAAGLSADQLTRLGKSAKDASIVLGRDVTDSFNRLIRGVTKAEPELLDELGIILRLEDASNKYGLAIGKAGNDLTTFERQQAVANEVLEQAEQKYSRLLEITDPAANAFNKFGKAFDDMANRIRIGTNDVLADFAEAAAASPFAALLVAAPLVVSSLKMILPGVAEATEGASAKFNKLGQNIAAFGKKAKNDLAAIKFMEGDPKAAKDLQQLASDDLMALEKKQATGFRGAKTLAKGGNLALSTLKKNIKDAEQGMGAFANMTKKTRMQYVSAFKDMQAATTTLGSTIQTTTAKGKLHFDRFATGARTLMAKGMAGVTAGVGAMVAGLPMLFSRVLPALGAMALVFEMLPDNIKKAIKESLGFRILEDQTKRILDRTRSLNEEFKNFAAVQRELASDLEGNYAATLSTLTAIAQMDLSTNVMQTKLLMEELAAGIEAAEKSAEKFRTMGYFAPLIRQLDFLSGGKVSEAFGSFASGLDDITDVTKKRIEQTIAALELLPEKTTGATADYLKALKDLNALDISNPADKLKLPTLSENLVKAENRFKSLTSEIKGFEASLKKLPQEVDNAFKGLLPTGKFASVISGLQQADKALFETRKNAQTGIYELVLTEAGQFFKESLDFSEEKNKKLAEEIELNARIMVMYQEQRDAYNDLSIAAVRRRTAEFELLDGATTRQAKQIQVEGQMSSLKEQIMKNTVTEETTLKAIALRKGNITEEEINVLALNRAQREQLEAQLKLLETQQGRVYQIGQALKNGLEQGLEANIYNLLTGEEKSIKDAILKIGQTALKSLAKTLSQQMTDSIMGLFGRKTEKQKEREFTLDTYRKAGAQVREDIKQGFADARAAVTGDPAREGARYKLLTEDSTTQPITDPAEKANLNRQADLAKLDPKKPTSVAIQEANAARAKDDEQTRLLLEQADATLKSLEETQKVMEQQLSTKVTRVAIVDNPDGTTTTFTQKTGDPSSIDETTNFNRPDFGVGDSRAQKQAKENAKTNVQASGATSKAAEEMLGAGKEQAKAGFQMNKAALGMGVAGIGMIAAGGEQKKAGFVMMAAAIAQQIAATMQASSGGSGGLLAMFGMAAAGGVFSDGKKRSYQPGGIASGPSSGYPVMLHGTEAVVPLPDGKSIPVQMSGGGGGTNNVTVNVNMETGETTTEENKGPNMAELGKTVAAAVQAELQHQKRPGGILSPFGAS